MGGFILDGGNVKGRMESEGSSVRAAAGRRVWRQQSSGGSCCGRERSTVSLTACFSAVSQSVGRCEGLTDF